MSTSHIICYCLLAFCFVVAKLIGDEINQKPDPKVEKSAVAD